MGGERGRGGCGGRPRRTPAERGLRAMAAAVSGKVGDHMRVRPGFPDLGDHPLARRGGCFKTARDGLQRDGIVRTRCAHRSCGGADRGCYRCARGGRPVWRSGRDVHHRGAAAASGLPTRRYRGDRMAHNRNIGAGHSPTVTLARGPAVGSRELSHPRRTVVSMALDIPRLDGRFEVVSDYRAGR